MKPDDDLWEVGAGTETGYVREENQDRMSRATVPLGQLYIVADGMGGHMGGARAAELTIKGLEQNLTEADNDVAVEDALLSAIEKTNQEVYDQAHAGDPATEGMGSTAVVLLISDRTAKIAHVGDSRAYLYRNSQLKQLTKDHSQVQKMVDAGMLTPDQARDHPSSSVLDRAIGNRAAVEADISQDIQLDNGDGILLCSDGLCGYAEDSDINAVIDDCETAQQAVDSLINLALYKGGEDNITVQFIRYGKPSKLKLVFRNFIRIVSRVLKKLLFKVFPVVALVGATSYLTYIATRSEQNECSLPNAINRHCNLIRQKDEEIKTLAIRVAKLREKLKEECPEKSPAEKQSDTADQEVNALNDRNMETKDEALQLPNGAVEPPQATNPNAGSLSEK